MFEWWWGGGLTHRREMTLPIRLVYHTQVAIYLFKVHYAFDAQHSGAVCSGVFAGAPEPGVSSCC